MSESDILSVGGISYLVVWWLIVLYNHVASDDSDNTFVAIMVGWMWPALAVCFIAFLVLVHLPAIGINKLRGKRNV